MWNKFKHQKTSNSDTAQLNKDLEATCTFCPLTLFEQLDVNEILLEGCRTLWLVTDKGRIRQPSPFHDTDSITRWVRALAHSANVRLDPVIGAAGGVLRSGSLRWHCLLAPMAVDGPIVSIRRHRFNQLTLSDFAMSEENIMVLKDAVASRTHLIISGPTGSGKTSLMAALIKEISEDERVFLLESVPEIGVLTPGTVRLVARQANLERIGGFGLERLLSESLRLLPDRLIVGEVRATEAAVLVDALRAGHSGVMSTMHASSAKEALARITTMANLGTCDWVKDLSAPVLVVAMERGRPPRVTRIEPL